MRARGLLHRKPPRVEFLPDELVEYDVDEVLPDEFVLDDVSTDSSVGFAGPSDAPPPYPATLQTFTGSWPPEARARSRGKRTVRLAWAAAGLAGFCGLVVVARTTLFAAPSKTTTTTASDPSEVSSATTPPAETSTAPSASNLPVWSSVAAADATDAASASNTSAGDAVDIKHRAQQALEKGKLTDALDLGQQAVDADPTDAESWLILGATYLQRGKYKDARRCFASCVDQATQGDVSECKALLR